VRWPPGGGGGTAPGGDADRHPAELGTLRRCGATAAGLGCAPRRRRRRPPGSRSRDARAPRAPGASLCSMPLNYGIRKKGTDALVRTFRPAHHRCSWVPDRGAVHGHRRVVARVGLPEAAHLYRHGDRLGRCHPRVHGAQTHGRPCCLATSVRMRRSIPPGCAT
jgi:hypothetical protein